MKGKVSLLRRSLALILCIVNGATTTPCRFSGLGNLTFGGRKSVFCTTSDCASRVLLRISACDFSAHLLRKLKTARMAGCTSRRRDSRLIEPESLSIGERVRDLSWLLPKVGSLVQAESDGSAFYQASESCKVAKDFKSKRSHTRITRSGYRNSIMSARKWFPYTMLSNSTIQHRYWF